eukprot:6255943-Pyramimonas_sp.AAC.1
MASISTLSSACRISQHMPVSVVSHVPSCALKFIHILFRCGALLLLLLLLYHFFYRLPISNASIYSAETRITRNYAAHRHTVRDDAPFCVYRQSAIEGKTTLREHIAGSWWTSVPRHAMRFTPHGLCMTFSAPSARCGQLPFLSQRRLPSSPVEPNVRAPNQRAPLCSVINLRRARSPRSRSRSRSASARRAPPNPRRAHWRP